MKPSYRMKMIKVLYEHPNQPTKFYAELLEIPSDIASSILCGLRNANQATGFQKEKSTIETWSLKNNHKDLLVLNELKTKHKITSAIESYYEKNNRIELYFIPNQYGKDPEKLETITNHKYIFPNHIYNNIINSCYVYCKEIKAPAPTNKRTTKPIKSESESEIIIPKTEKFENIYEKIKFTVILNTSKILDKYCYYKTEEKKISCPITVLVMNQKPSNEW